MIVNLLIEALISKRSEKSTFPKKQYRPPEPSERERPLPQRKYRHPEPKEMHQTTFSIVAFSKALCNLPG